MRLHKELILRDLFICLVFWVLQLPNEEKFKVSISIHII